MQGRDRDTDVKDRHVNMWEEEKVGRIESVALTNIHYHVSEESEMQGLL